MEWQRIATSGSSLAEFVAVQQWLQELNLGEVRPSKVNPNCPCLILPSERVIDDLRLLRSRLPPGLIAFIGDYSETNQFYPERVILAFHELVIGPGQHPLDALELVGTQNNTGVNLRQRLLDWDARFGIELTEVKQRAIAFGLHRLPDDLPAFVAELYAVAPDPVDCGWAQSLEIWHEMIEAHHSVYLYWL